MTKTYIPNRIQIYASRAIVKASKKLGREVEPDVIRVAAWPLEKAAPYPEKKRA